MSYGWYKSLNWILIVSIYVLSQLAIQLIWYAYALSGQSWVVVQFLITIWLVISILKIVVGRSEADSRVSSSNSNEPPMKKENLGSVVDPENLIGSVVHEIRNPLNRIQLQLKKLNTEDAENDLQEALVDLKDIVQLIEKVFQSSELNRRWLSIPRFIDTLNEKSRLPGEVIFRVELDWIYCAPEQLLVALQNLIENSFEAYDSQTGIVVVEFKKLGPEFCIRVKDEAGGFSKDFEQSDFTESEGMGLGLMITRKIMSNHGGRMVIENENNGATVTLTLPNLAESSWKRDSVQ